MDRDIKCGLQLETHNVQKTDLKSSTFVPFSTNLAQLEAKSDIPVKGDYTVKPFLSLRSFFRVFAKNRIRSVIIFTISNCGR